MQVINVKVPNLDTARNATEVLNRSIIRFGVHSHIIQKLTFMTNNIPISDELIDLVNKKIDSEGSKAFFYPLAPIKPSQELDETGLNTLISCLEKKQTALSYLVCGLLLEGYIETDRPDRYQDENQPEYISYIEKRRHDAVSFYLRAINEEKTLKPIIEGLLWQLKISGSVSLQRRLAQYDVPPPLDWFSTAHLFTHEAVKMPLLNKLNFFYHPTPVAKERKKDMVQGNEQQGLVKSVAP